jgi:hypothetical protein
MDVVAKMDEGGRTAWIVAMILGFVIFWPVGLALLVFLIWSGRIGRMNHHTHQHWNTDQREEWRARCGEMRDEMRARKEEWRAQKRAWREEMRERWHSHKEQYWTSARPSGNAAFDEYKLETIRRLEEEQQEFQEFLDNLRKSRDKAEFDQFMSSRRGGPEDARDVTPPDPDNNG